MASETPKSVDIKKSGVLTPDETSRPIIVGHQTNNVDPMMVTKEERALTHSAPIGEQKTTVAGVKNIAPLNIPEAEPKKPTDEPQKPKVTLEKQIDSQEYEESASDNAAQKREITDANGMSDGASSEERYQELLKQKTYFLNIKSTAGRNKATTLAVLFACGLLSIVSVAYVAMDAGYIKAPFTLPVDLIKNNDKAPVQPIPTPISTKPSITPTPTLTPTPSVTITTTPTPSITVKPTVKTSTTPTPTITQ